MAFLEFNSISKGYPGVQALSNVSFGVEKGAVHGLMGENGAGKSTLIRVLSGDQSADEGSILIDGVEQKYSSVRDAFHAGVIVIHQELQLVPELTVAENLWLGRFPGKAGIIDGKVLIDSSANPGLIVDILLFRKDVIEARQADVQKVVDAYWQAVEYVKSNPDESIEIMARNVGGWLEDPQAFAATLTGVQLYDQAMNQAFFADPDAPGFQTAQFAIDLWTAQGRISDPLTATDIIDNSFLGE